MFVSFSTVADRFLLHLTYKRYQCRNMFIQINTNTNKIYKAWFTKCPRALTNVKRRGERDEFLSAAYMPSCGVCVCVCHVRGLCQNE